MEGYQQLFALIKNSKYVKMCLPENGWPSKLNNTANAGRIVRGRNGRKILPAFLLTILLRHLPPPRYRRKRKSAEINSAQIRKKKFCKSRQDDTAGKSSRERQAPALYAAVRVRRRSYGVSRIPRFVAGRITGHRRSLPQPSSAAWCPPPLHWSRAYLPHVAAY